MSARGCAEGGVCRLRRDEDAELAASGSCGRQREIVGAHLVTDPLVLKDSNSMWGQVDNLGALCVEQITRVLPMALAVPSLNKCRRGW